MPASEAHSPTRFGDGGGWRLCEGGCGWLAAPAQLPPPDCSAASASHPHSKPIVGGQFVFKVVSNLEKELRFCKVLV